MEIRFSKKRYKVKQIVAAEEGSAKAVRDLIAGMMYDANKGEYLPFEEAMATLDELDGEEFDEMQALFMEKLKEFSRAAVPLATKGKS